MTCCACQNIITRLFQSTLNGVHHQATGHRDDGGEAERSRGGGHGRSEKERLHRAGRGRKARGTDEHAEEAWVIDYGGKQRASECRWTSIFNWLHCSMYRPHS